MCFCHSQSALRHSTRSRCAFPAIKATGGTHWSARHSFLRFRWCGFALRALFSDRLSTPGGRRLLWIFAALSVLGTIAVETPFLLHLAGTSEWQRLSVLALGFGIPVASGILLYLRRRSMPPASACLAALNAAYLANAALCLVIYSDAPGAFSSKTGWYVTVALFWPILAELIWLLVGFRHTSALAE
jgi:hypothetical protein